MSAARAARVLSGRSPHHPRAVSWVLARDRRDLRLPRIVPARHPAPRLAPDLQPRQPGIARHVQRQGTGGRHAGSRACRAPPTRLRWSSRLLHTSPGWARPPSSSRPIGEKRSRQGTGRWGCRGSHRRRTWRALQGSACSGEASHTSRPRHTSASFGTHKLSLHRPKGRSAIPITPTQPTSSRTHRNGASQPLRVRGKLRASHVVRRLTVHAPAGETQRLLLVAPVATRGGILVHVPRNGLFGVAPTRGAPLRAQAINAAQSLSRAGTHSVPSRLNKGRSRTCYRCTAVHHAAGAVARTPGEMASISHTEATSAWCTATALG